MEKSKRKPAKFPKFDRLSQRIRQATRAIAKKRKERAQRAFERSLLLT